MKIITSVVNNPIFIEIQYYTLKKYLLNCDYEFIVFNDAKTYPDFTNGNDVTIRDKIFETCKKLNIQCIPVTNAHQQFMDCPVIRCVEAMNFMYDYMLNNKDEYLILDSDMFLIDYMDINKYRKYDCAIVLQCREQYLKIEYIWNGLFYFNLHKMNNPELINWDQLLNSDVGGLSNTWLLLQNIVLPDTIKLRTMDKTALNTLNQNNKIYFIRHLWSLTWNDIEMPDKLKNSKIANFIRNDPRNKDGRYYCEIYDDVFLHYRGGGDWSRKGLEFHIALANDLKYTLIG